jgi:CheY-like chemotaxis protein/predicted  nucleic acid-binding Zn-ribbon protein
MDSKRQENSMLHFIVADPNPKIAEQLTEATDATRVQITHVGAGEALFDVAHREEPSLIFLSSDVPKGFFWCGKLRKSAATGSVPLVMVYEESHAATIAKHQKLPVRATSYMEGPVSNDGLLALLKQYVPDAMSTFEEPVELEVQEIALPEPAPESDVALDETMVEMEAVVEKDDVEAVEVVVEVEAEVEAEVEVEVEVKAPPEVPNVSKVAEPSNSLEERSDSPMAVLRAELQRVEEGRARASAQVAELTAQIESERVDAELRYSEVKTSLETLRTEHVTDLARVNEDLRIKMEHADRTQEELSAARENNTVVQSRLAQGAESEESVRSENQSLQTQVANLNQEIQGLRETREQELANSGIESKKTNDEVERLQSEIGSVTPQLESMSADLVQKTQELERLTLELQQSREDTRLSKEQLQAKDMELNGVLDSRAGTEMNYAEVKGVLEARSSELDQLQEAIDIRGREIIELRENLAAATRERAELLPILQRREQDLDEARAKSREAMRELDGVKNDLTRSSTRTRSLEEDLDKAVRRADSVEKELPVLTKERDALKAENTALTGQIRSLRSEVTETHARIESSVQELSTSHSRTMELEERVRGNAFDWDEQKKALEKQVEELLQEHRSLSFEMKALGNELVKTSSNFGAFSKRWNELFTHHFNEENDSSTGKS